MITIVDIKKQKERIIKFYIKWFKEKKDNNNYANKNLK